MLNRTCWLMLFIFAIGYLHVYMWWPDMVFNFYAVRKSFHLLIKPLQTSWRVSNIVIVFFFLFYFSYISFSFCFLVEFQSNRVPIYCYTEVNINHFSSFFFSLLLLKEYFKISYEDIYYLIFTFNAKLQLIARINHSHFGKCWCWKLKPNMNSLWMYKER